MSQSSIINNDNNNKFDAIELVNNNQSSNLFREGSKKDSGLSSSYNRDFRSSKITNKLEENYFDNNVNYKRVSETIKHTEKVVSSFIDRANEIKEQTITQKNEYYELRDKVAKENKESGISTTSYIFTTTIAIATLSLLSVSQAFILSLIVLTLLQFSKLAQINLLENKKFDYQELDIESNTGSLIVGQADDDPDPPPLEWQRLHDPGGGYVGSFQDFVRRSGGGQAIKI